MEDTIISMMKFNPKRIRVMVILKLAMDNPVDCVATLYAKISLYSLKLIFIEFRFM